MRFVIEAPQLQRGLRVIPEIPDFEICRLEGPNGVGKTLAIRLLELATGQQPFARYPAAWRSLQAGLGQVTVHIQKIPGHSDIVVRLDPDLWNPASPADPGRSLGTAEANGRPLSLAEVGRIVRVIRISGDETLEDAVRGLLQDDLTASERMVVQINSRRTSISAELAIVNDMLGSILPERLLSEEQRLSGLRQKLDTEVNLLDAAAERQSKLARAQSLADQLDATRSTVPELERERDSVRARIAELELERTELDSRRRDMEPQLSTEKVLSEQIAKAEHLRRTRAHRLLDIEKQMTSLAEATGVLGRAPDIKIALQASQDRSVRLKDRIASIDSEGVILGIMDQMTTPLDGARIRGFGADVIARFDGNYERIFGRATDVQVNDLIAGLARQRAVISERKRSKELEELSSQLRTEQWQAAELQRLAELAAKRDRAAELLRDIDQDLRDLSERAPIAIAEEYRAVSERISQIDYSIREASIRDVEIIHRIELVSGGQTEDQIRLKLDQELIELALPVSEVHDAALQHQAVVMDLEHSVSAINAELDDVRLLLEAMRSQLRPVLQELVRHPSLPWLSDLFADEVQNAGDNLGLLSDLVGRLHVASGTVDTQLNHLIDDVQAFRAALADLARVISRRETTTETSTEELLPRLYGPEVRSVFSKRLRSEFSQREVAEAVFDSGEVLEVDLSRLEITWRTAGGELLTRPFEAFSSGERAFAYTRARMEAIANVPATNRVIMLDEFGAFLASDRLDTLIRYVQDAVIGFVAAQVVLVLPLSSDLSDRNAELAQSSRLRTRVAALERQHYFAESAIAAAVE